MTAYPFATVRVSSPNAVIILWPATLIYLYPDPRLTNTFPEPWSVTWRPVDSSKLIPVIPETEVLTAPPLPLVLLTVTEGSVDQYTLLELPFDVNTCPTLPEVLPAIISEFITRFALCVYTPVIVYAPEVLV